jgi:hypothetical protein
MCGAMHGAGVHAACKLGRGTSHWVLKHINIISVLSQGMQVKRETQR